MDQDSGRPDPAPDDEVQVPAAPVRPRMRGRAIPILPRTLGVALIVGVLAFLAGAQLSPPHGTAPTGTTATPIPAESPELTSTPAPTVLPDQSGFASSFDPFARALKAGFPCFGGGGGGGSGGGQSHLIVTGSCYSPAAGPTAPIVQLEGEISTAIRDTAISRDGGFGSSIDEAGATFTVMSWDYRSGAFDGSIYLVATTVGSDVHVVIILTEKVRA